MIEAVCDKCGKRIVLSVSYGGSGFNFPTIWKIKTQPDPETRSMRYKTFCFDCRIKNEEADE